MALISFDKDTVVDYMPAFGGNRKSDDPCIVRMRFVPFSRVQHYNSILAARNKEMQGDPEAMNEVGNTIQKKQFVENVEGISGYFIGEREVTEPGEFYEVADKGLIYEILVAMENSQKLSEGQRKN